MDGTRNDRTEIAEALQRARRLLEARLEPREAGRALRQLLERERQREAVEAITPADLLDRLIAGLGDLGPEGLVYVGTMRALLALDGHEPRRLLCMLAGGEAAAATVAPHVEAAAASDAADPAVPDAGQPTVAAPAIALPPAASSAVAAKPAPCASPAATVARAATSPPIVEVAASPVALAIASAPPVRSELGRIRLIDALAAATGATERSRERYGGAVSWARLEASWRPPPEIEPIAEAGTGARVRPAGPAASQPLAAAVAPAHGPDADAPAAIPVSPALRAVPVAAPAAAAATSLAIDLEGKREIARSAEARRLAGRPRTVDEAEIEIEVEEAEVEIVAGLSPPPITAPPRPERPASPPMPLTLRLKRQEQEQIEFDGDSYAAYYDDLGEASVEIVRPPDFAPKPAVAASTAPPARDARRLLRVLARKSG